MKVLLTTLNSKYIHSNLAIKYLYSAAKDCRSFIDIKEFSINGNNFAVEIVEQQPSYFKLKINDKIFETAVHAPFVNTALKFVLVFKIPVFKVEPVCPIILLNEPLASFCHCILPVYPNNESVVFVPSQIGFDEARILTLTGRMAFTIT